VMVLGADLTDLMMMMVMGDGFEQHLFHALNMEKILAFPTLLGSYVITSFQGSPVPRTQKPCMPICL